ncbi:MAG: hypothetical protein KAW56_05420 [Candidatus Marinimicrobia bacterium]|nr:hypothetical protein [Candidatus Neomarinimicrobiota bacterium]
MPGILGLISDKNEEKLFDKICQKLNYYDYGKVEIGHALLLHIITDKIKGTK